MGKEIVEVSLLKDQQRQISGEIPLSGNQLKHILILSQSRTKILSKSSTVRELWTSRWHLDKGMEDNEET